MTKLPMKYRMRAALDAWRNGPNRGVNPWRTDGGMIEQKSPPFMVWPDYRNDNPQWRLVNLEAYIEEGYNINSLIYAAVMYKARAAATPPLVAYTGDVEQPERLPADHPLSMLCSRPNPSQSWREFQMLQTIFLNIAGECYSYIERDRDGTPMSLYPLQPQRMYIIPRKKGKRGIIGFVYVPEGASVDNRDNMKFLADDIIHTKLPNPGDPLSGDGYGFSPISPMARSGDVDNMISHFLQVFFERGAIPAGLLKFDMPLDDRTVGEVKKRWQTVYGGYEKWSDVGVLDRGGDYSRIGMSFSEMGFGDLDERNETRILSVFGVPPILIGSRVGLMRSTYSNYEQARDAFWQDTMVSELSLFQDDWQYHLSDGDSFPAYDFSSVPALVDDNDTEVAQMADAFTRGAATLNEYRTILGLDLVDSDVYLLPVSMMRIPVNEQPPAVAQSSQPDQTDDQREEPKARQNKRFEWSAEHKAAHYKAIDKIATGWEPKYAEAAVKAFEHDRRGVLAILTDESKAALRNKASVNWEAYYERVMEWLDSAGEDFWRETFLPLIRGTVIDQADRWSAVLGMQFDVQNLEARNWFNNYALKFAQPIMQTTADDLGTILASAQADGLSIPDVTKRIGALFDIYENGGELTDEEARWFADRRPRYRRELIARTETIRASNAGSMATFEAWGVPQKEWLATLDGRTRDTHLAMNGKPPIPFYQAFISPSGASLQYPGDPDAPIAETANCRCVALPILQRPV